LNYISPPDSSGIKISATIEDTLSVISDKSTQIEPEEWARKIYLNTTSSGAYITSDIESFPVLVRLSGANFNFAQSDAGGTDIWFEDSDKTLLPIEIEHWDSTLNTASIWVKTGIIKGNSAYQHIIMHWGGNGAPSSSNPNAVFGSHNQFAGVWHLGENADSTGSEDIYRDATGDGNHGNDF
ncbi:MAG: DUF2341 domain-containing protein, partial [Planctomycetes bacterium]|nr:DUF2341 domain-containing protein [Planctomycetota bacterium]